MQCRGICRLSVYKSQESLLCESIGKILVKLHSIISRWVFTQTVLKVRVTLVIFKGHFSPHFQRKTSIHISHRFTILAPDVLNNIETKAT